MSSVLRFTAVSYRYGAGSDTAISDVTFAIEEGDFVVLAGRSGSGKSTVIRAACGLAPHFYGGSFAGSVEVVGRSTKDHDPGKLAAHVGTVLQDPETQTVMNTVRAELAFPLQNKGLSAAAVARGVEETALVLGIEQLLEQSTDKLSGGELQRVVLAAAIVTRPHLILLDEPTSQLDPVAGDELIWFLRRLNEEWGTTVVLAEQRLERCLPAANRVIAFEDGRLAQDGSPQEFLQWAAENEPDLLTPAAALFANHGLAPLPTSVKEARAALARTDLTLRPAEEQLSSALPRPDSSRGFFSRIASRGTKDSPAVRARGLSFGFTSGQPVLERIDFAVQPGELVALVGRNGAGKSTFLQLLAGLLKPSRGTVQSAGRTALLLQNPGDYFVHERAGDEVSLDALVEFGLEDHADANPRDLSGGERQRLALAAVLGGSQQKLPTCVCLDEPTRGLDRGHKRELAERLGQIAGRGCAVLVATHDMEFAASFARRTVLFGKGHVIADGLTAEILAGGHYFSTESSRILAGTQGRPEDEDKASAPASSAQLEEVA